MRVMVLVLFGLLAASVLTGQAQQAPFPEPRVIHPIIRPTNNKSIDASVNKMATGPTLVFDADTKEYDAQANDRVAPFSFTLTNVWTNEIRIDDVHPSCGCTTADLPEKPWHLPPGKSGKIVARINLEGKPPGMLTKTLTFYTSVGNRVLYLKVKIPPADIGSSQLSEDDRKAAMAIAAADAHTIFRGDCAKCHVDKGVGAMGQDLYAADCGICHESSHRATAVPDLHTLKQAINLDYWKTIITYGKPHTMMPGFAKSQGGPLTDEQVNSLAAYLNHTISHNFSPAGTQ